MKEHAPADEPDWSVRLYDPEAEQRYLANTIAFLDAALQDHTVLPDTLERDLVATFTFEERIGNSVFTTNKCVVGNVLGIDLANPADPCVILGNVVYYDQAVDMNLPQEGRTVTQTSDTARIPLSVVSEPSLTDHMRQRRCGPDSWHNRVYPRD